MAASAGTAGKILAGIRVALGRGAWGAPNRSTKLFGLDPERSPQLAFLARCFGVREIVLAVFAMRSTGPIKRLAWQLGVACDTLDICAGLLARRNGTLGTPGVLVVGASGLLAVGLGIAEAASTPA